MKGLLNDCHEAPGARKHLKRRALTLFRSLVEADILELVPLAKRDGGPPVRIQVDLQEDFSIHHALALYLIDALKALDPLGPTYALDVLTLVESILESPDLILQKQVDKLKTEKIAELKAAGVEYEERMAALEKIEHPKPNAAEIYDTFNAFAKVHPWLAEENIRPKSIAREMYENFAAFREYIVDYGLERAEGLLLRYLTDVYKALEQTVPAWAKNDTLEDITLYFGAMVRGVDSSLLDEWERMMTLGLAAFDPAKRLASTEEETLPGTKDITRDKKTFTVLVRNHIFAFVRALSRRNYESAAELVRAPEGEPVWSKERLEKALAPFYAEHAALRTDPAARGPASLRIEEVEGFWQVEQVLFDVEGDEDWVVRGRISLDASRVEGMPVLLLERGE
jgi:hypothetical protein